MTQILIARDEPAFIKKAAQLILETSVEAVQQRQRATWSLSGGDTPKRIFPTLIEPYFKERIPWRDVSVFWGDERCVPPDHADSNYKMAMDAFLSKSPIAETNIHRMPGEMHSPQDGAKAYEQELKLFFRHERPFPKFDLMLLGIGEDGHTASLFPGTSALKEKEKWVVGHAIPNVATPRITLTYPVINNARRIVVAVTGEAKAGILKEILREDMERDDVAFIRTPALGIQAVQGELIWLLDAAAASKLPAALKFKAANI